MTSNYKRLGDYIEETNTRDVDLAGHALLGVSIKKMFIPSIANTIGTDMSTYKILNKGQFAYGPVTSRNGDKISIALLEDEENALVSQSYRTFEITDNTKLLPEYLMMWFKRPEFDRYARFMSHGSTREVFDWDEMCNVEIPVPDIHRQKEIVREYNILVDRINLNDQLINKLEETAQSIYKQWFVDFEFPDEDGKPYKSAGGEMVFNNSVGREIPKDWESKNLSYYVSGTKGGDWGKVQDEGNYDSQVYCIRGTDMPNLRNGKLGEMPTRYILNKNLDTKELTENQIVIEISGGSPTQSTGRTVHVTKNLLGSLDYPIICSNFCQALTVKDPIFSSFLFSHINFLYKNDIFFNYENSTIGLKNLDLRSILSDEQLVIPSDQVLEKFNTIYQSINSLIITFGTETEILTNHHDLFLSNLMVSKIKKRL